MHIILGLVLAFFAFAILLRPLRWLVGLWLVFLAVAFAALIVSGAIRKFAGIGGGFFDQYADIWMLVAMYVTPRVIGAFVAISVVYRLVEELAVWSRRRG